ncbi:SMR family transporter [Prochlorothrix hollandica]|uniref:SMR family transporter n=1 Tax=Prochlorothrix hollandica TaxID=1223 RepID=UPI00034C2ADF|nr:SMR family transporter [Prochlorothrix hollandica]
MLQTVVTLVLILFSAVLNTSAQVLLKFGADQSPINPYVIGGLFTYGVSSIVYIGLLGRLNLSLVYPIIIGITTIATVTAGLLIFKEKISFTSWMGVGLVLAGIFTMFLGRSAQS